MPILKYSFAVKFNSIQLTEIVLNVFMSNNAVEYRESNECPFIEHIENNGLDNSLGRILNSKLAKIKKGLEFSNTKNGYSRACIDYDINPTFVSIVEDCCPDYVFNWYCDACLSEESIKKIWVSIESELCFKQFYLNKCKECAPKFLDEVNEYLSTGTANHVESLILVFSEFVGTRKYSAEQYFYMFEEMYETVRYL